MILFLNMKTFFVKFSLLAALVFVAIFLVYKLDLIKEKNVFFSLGGEAKDKINILEYGSNALFADADFFKKAKEKLQTGKEDFIEADLTGMVLRVYKEGEFAFEVPIKTKGREGSWWETPSGIYKIQYKAENHFSSFGSVYQPYSLAFEGNFFIHGWPYYPDGTPVASTFSGGCIRLSDEDAKKVFESSSVGMPVLVFEQDFVSDDFEYSMLTPQITAENYLIADLKNNFVFTEKNSFAQIPAGSTTKLLTALVSGEYINLDHDLMIPFENISATSTSVIKGGNVLSAYNLLFPLLLEDSTEPASAFVAKLGQKRFLALMNEKTKAVGMTSTNFVDATGESEENISTPQDLFLLLKYLYNNRSFILKISSGNLENSAYGVAVFNDLFKNNLFAEDKSFIGGQLDIDENISAEGELVKSEIMELDQKTSGSMAVIFEMRFKGEDRPIVFILNNSSDIVGDVQRIKEYISQLYL